MSNSSSIKLSSIAAFSYHWNKGIDRKESYFIRLGKSIAVFFKTLFCGYIVSEVEAKAFFYGDGQHGSSLFIKECNRKFENFNIKIVNNPANLYCATERNSTEFINELRMSISVTENLDHDDKNNSDKREASKIKDSQFLDYDDQNNADKQKPSEIKDSQFFADDQEPSEIKDSQFFADNQEPSEIKDSQLTEEMKRVDELVALMMDKNYVCDERFSEDNLRLLGSGSRFRLFECASKHHRSSIMNLLINLY